MGQARKVAAKPGDRKFAHSYDRPDFGRGLSSTQRSSAFGRGSPYGPGRSDRGNNDYHYASPEMSNRSGDIPE